ncbi:MAG: hypothetical protein HS111_32910 [Kofleriaceae bacterium]|nr:hypothetical protein [Kofleriaceae bacterium]
MPTGAGGYWGKMILDTDLIGGARGFLGGVFATDASQRTFLHPGLALLGVSWPDRRADGVDDARRRPPPAGRGSRCATSTSRWGRATSASRPEIFDAAALAYGNRQAGAVLWPELQAALALDGLDGVDASGPVMARQRRRAHPGRRAVRQRRHRRRALHLPPARRGPAPVRLLRWAPATCAPGRRACRRRPP